MFDDASKPFLDAVEQAVRLIRSKGVGVFFVTQAPTDVPDGVLAQLGNRVQHALRAFTPNDAKALKATVSTFPKSDYDLAETLTSLGTGEAIVTVLSERGAPTPVAWTMLRAPQSTIGPSEASVMEAAVAASPLREKCAEALDRESAYEKLNARLEPEPAPDAVPASTDTDAQLEQAAKDGQWPEDKPKQKTSRSRSKPTKTVEDDSVMDKVVGSPAFRSMLRSAGTVIGREISRSAFGTAKRRSR